MRKNENTQHIEGRLYQHNLEIKTVKNQTSENFGKEFISGTMDIAVDEAGLNVLQVHFTYVTPTTNSIAQLLLKSLRYMFYYYFSFPLAITLYFTQFS